MTSRVVQPGDMEFGDSQSSQPDALGAGGSLSEIVGASQPGSGVSAIPQTAIDEYVNGLAEALSYDGPFSEILAKSVVVEYNAYQSQPAEYWLQLTLPDVQRGVARSDFERAFGIWVFETDLADLFQLNGPSDERIELDFSFVPETQKFRTWLMQPRQQQPNSVYFEILKLPRDKRPFFAGLIHYLQGKRYNFGKGDTSIDAEPSHPQFGLDTRTIVEYAGTVGIHKVLELNEAMRLVPKVNRL